MMFKFLTNENKGGSLCSIVQDECFELVRSIIETEHHLTTIYPHIYLLNDEEYSVRSLSYWFDIISKQVIYTAQVEHRNYIVNVELKRGIHERI